MGQLDGNAAIVTGASSGIGRAIALELAREGAAVALVSRRREKLDEVLAEVEKLGGQGLVIPADLSNPEQARGVVDTALGRFESLSILVNNAGVTRDNLIMRMKDEEWDTVIDTNLRSAFLLSRAVARPFMKRRGGRIINIASIVGLIGNPGQANYAASKGGLIALTYTLAKELGSRGILVNAVAPGFIETAMTEDLPEATRSAAVQEIPVARFGQPEEIARVVAFLSGPGASYINGVVLRVDGGMGI